jgi:hypothetical protein
LLGIEGVRLETPFAWEFETSRLLARLSSLESLRPDQTIAGLVTSPVDAQQLEAAIACVPGLVTSPLRRTASG